jgi:transposase-like protein
MTENRSEIIEGLVVSRKRNGRRVYSVQAKRALVEACRRPGISVGRMALIHGLNANLLRKWIRRDQRKQAVVSRAESSQTVALLPVRAIDERLAAKRPVVRQESVPTDSCIEIVLCAATVRLRGRVDVRQLREVIDCVMRRR